MTIPSRDFQIGEIAQTLISYGIDEEVAMKMAIDLLPYYTLEEKAGWELNDIIIIDITDGVTSVRLRLRCSLKNRFTSLNR